jgi:Uma2 family endonuclease
MSVLELPVETEEEVLRPPIPDIELLETDSEPLDSEWHRYAINLLTESIDSHFENRDDYAVGGDTFIYYNLEQARELSYRGPDFFFVDGVPRKPGRKYWVVWQEGGRYPDVIIELASPSTAKTDRTTKKAIYEQVFHTYEYFIYDPGTLQLEGWRLVDDRYQPLTPDAQGRLESKKLGLWVGRWEGQHGKWPATTTWLRFYEPGGNVVLLLNEKERQRAEAEKQRADALEAEVFRLKAQLDQMQGRASK